MNIQFKDIVDLISIINSLIMMFMLFILTDLRSRIMRLESKFMIRWRKEDNEDNKENN